MSKENIERLRAKRGGYRGVCTKLVKEVFELLDSSEVDIERCEVIAEQLESKMKILDEINDEIIGICDVADIEHEIEEAAAVTDKILNTRRKIETARKPKVSQEIVGNVSNGATSSPSPTPQVEQIPDTVEPTVASTSNITISSDENMTSTTASHASNTNTNASNMNTNASNTSTNAVNTNTNVATSANSTTSNAPTSTTQVSMALPKLPKLQLPKFNGKVTEWSAFWDLYNATIHSNESMSKVNKFNYLFSFLEGSAARSIKGLTLTSANYDAAIAILQERFGRTQQVIAAHMDQILQIPACSENRTGQLRYVFDQISVHVRGLESLGVSADQYGSLLIPIIMSKLPNEIRLQVARKATSEVWKIDELLKTIKFEVEAREISEATRSSEKTHNSKDKSSRPSTAGAFVVTREDKDGASSFKVKCVYCQEFHYSASCEKVKDKDTRVKILRDSKRCFICLRKGHQASKCDATKKCRHCSGRHHQSICSNPTTSRHDVENKNLTDHSNPESVLEGANPPTTTAVTQTTKGSILLQTARAIVSNGSRSVPARILFDTGSQRSYIRKSLQGRLRLSPVGKETLHLNTFGENKSKRENCEVFKVNITNKNGGEDVEITAIGFPTICAPLPSRINVDEYPHLDGLELADLDSSDSQGSCDTIDMLIGADYYWDIVTGDVVQGENGPTAMSSKLGWLLSGWSSQQSTVGHTFNSLILAGEHLDNSSVTSDEDELTTSLKRFWETESVGIDFMKSESPPAEQEFVRNIRFTGTRYEVGLPWKHDHAQIDDDYELCHNRLRSLHRKLLKDPKNLEEYNKGIEEQLATGIVERVPASDKDHDNIHYLPHHCVIRKDKVTTKLRVVYDGSATTESRNYSLNDCLLTGPNLIPQIFDLLVRFRQNNIGLVADIEKAFLMIGIDKEDRDMLRFLWLKDAKDPNSEVLKLRFCRLVFGLRPSPAILGATIQHHLETHEKQEPEIVEHLKKSLYVDDFVSGAKTDDSALQIYKGAKQLMTKGGFNLRKWSSNSSNLVKSIEVLEGNETKSLNDGKSDVVQEDLSFVKSTIAKEFTTTGPTQVKVLGLAWDTADDTFLFNLAEIIEYAKSLPVTKRSLLKWSSKIFDPLGLLSPFTIKLKILFQVMCLDKLDWDGELHGDLRKQWNTLLSELESLHNVRVPRCYYLPHLKSLTTQIHGFSDASERAIGAVVYIRTVYENGSVDVKLIASKTRVAPVKRQTIPRLELVAATVLAKLVDSLLKALDWNVKVFYWVDSMTVLHWIRNDRPWKLYVQHRVNEIRSVSSTQSWSFCPGSLNPADLPSRGISGEELPNASLWFRGPEFLVEDEEEWPKCPAGYSSESKEALREVVNSPLNVVRSLVTNEVQQRVMVDPSKIIDIDRYSSMKKLLRVTAYVLKFINGFNKLRLRKQSKKRLAVGKRLTAEEIKEAELLWIRSVQQLHFENEISFVSSKNPLSSVPIYVKQFGLFLDGDHVLKCKGRLKNASIDLGSRYPILLPKKSRFVELLIREVHDKVKHSGIRDTLTTMRERYWIIRGRETVKKILRKCVVCRKAEGLPYGGASAPHLPVSRVSEDPPFTNVGLDFAGPLFVRESFDKASSSENATKVYILLFTCASTRAVHLELTPSLSVAAFLRAFRRYASRRGLPALLISDNAKTFRAACAEIRKLCRAEEVLRYLTDNQITWQFIVEKAPWWGGFWERLVRSIKRPLRKVIGRTNLTYDELQTIVVEIEGLINSRPLTYVYDDVESVSYPLSPSHLVYGRRITTMPNSEHYEIQSTFRSLTKKAKHHKSLLQHFTKQWKNEYLLALREQSITNSRGSRNPEIAIGDIVIIRSDQTKRIFWKLAKVEQLLLGEDGVARAAQVRVLRGDSSHSQLLRRSIKQLIPIEVRHEGESDNEGNTETDELTDQILPSTERPQRNAAIIGQLRRLKDMGKL